MTYPNLSRIPSGIWALGLVSLFMDISSEMIHSVLPIYLVTVLGASATSVGFMEGVAEATASITRIFSGVLSDRLGRRKPLVVLGYGLAAATKPVFAVAGSLTPLVAARFVDRVGKGIRGAPRDALVSEIAPPELRGASFGLRQSLDTVGAFAGPLLATGLLLLTAADFRMVFWVATVPAIVAVGVLLIGVREPEHSHGSSTARLELTGLSDLGRAFWATVGIAIILTLARFSEAFLLLRAQDVGLRLALAPMILAVMNIAYAFSAYPAGALTDRIGRRGVLLLGILLLLGADLVLAVGNTLPLLVGGVLLWGLHMGFTQGILAALVADSSPAHLRGSAFGLFNFATGLATLAASVLAGMLWDRHGPAATFLAGALFCALAALGMLANPDHRRPPRFLPPDR